MKKKCSQEIRWLKQWFGVEAYYEDKRIGWISKLLGSNTGYSWGAEIDKEHWIWVAEVPEMNGAKRDLIRYFCNE